MFILNRGKKDKKQKREEIRMNIKGRTRHNQTLQNLGPQIHWVRARNPPFQTGRPMTPQLKVQGFPDFIPSIQSLTHDVTALSRRVTTYLLNTIKLLGTTQNRGRCNLAQKMYFLTQICPKWPEGHSKEVQKYRSVPKAMFLSISIYFFSDRLMLTGYMDEVF